MLLPRLVTRTNRLNVRSARKNFKVSLKNRLCKHIQYLSKRPEDSSLISITILSTIVSSSHAAQPITSSNESVATSKCLLFTNDLLKKQAIITSETHAKEIDLEIATFFYATNTPFLYADLSHVSSNRRTALRR